MFLTHAAAIGFGASQLHDVRYKFLDNLLRLLKSSGNTLATTWHKLA
jgi:hypothetical protein